VHKGKHNLAPPEKATWVRLVPVVIGNGEVVATIEPWQFPDLFADLRPEHADRIKKIVQEEDWRADSRAERWVGHPIAQLLGLDLNKRTDKAKVKAIVDLYFKAGVLVKEKRRDKNSRKEVEF